jgi:hypothetical protein
MISLKFSNPIRRLDFSIMQHKSCRLRIPYFSLRHSKLRRQKAIVGRNVDRNLRSRVECAAEERIMMERFSDSLTIKATCALKFWPV